MPFVPGLIAAAGTALGAASGSVIFKLLSSVALSALSQALAPKPKTPGIKSEQTLQGETTPAAFVLGYYATNGSFPCPDMSHGKVGKTPNAYLTRIYHLSDVPGMTLSSLILDGERVTIGGGTDHVDYGQNISGRFNGYAWVKYYNGSQTTADAMLLAQYGSYPTRPWSADMIGRGVCYAILTFRRAPDIFNAFPVVRFEVSGIPLYDPRLDTTVGGSGAQRWANTATWAPSNNPMVQAYNVLRGIALQDGTVWGGKYTAADLPLAEWFAAMNACDATVPVAAGGTEARYRSGFEAAVTDEPAGVLEELLKACNAVLADVGGVVKPRVGGPALPVFFITDDDLIVSEAQDYNPAPGLADTYNAITATSPSPANLWEATAAPPRYYPAYEAQDGDRRLVADLSLPAVPYPRQVQRLMFGYIADERRFRRHNITLGPKAGVLEPMVDSIAWTSAVNGYIAKVFEVSEITDDLMSGLQRLAIRERDPADYDWSAGFELPTSPVPGGFVPPASQSVPSWAVTATTISDGTTDRRPALRLAWDGTDLDDVRALEWQVRRVGTTTVTQSGSTHLVETGGLVVSDGILPATAYEGRARLKVNRARAWSAWDAATTDDIRVGEADIADTVFETITGIAEEAGFTTVTSLPVAGTKDGQVVMVLPEGVLWRWNDIAGVWTRNLYGGIKPGDVDITKFASGIEPVGISTAGALPTVKTTTTIVWQGKIYRWNGSAYVATVPATDMTGQITEVQITNGAISAPKIAAGAIVAGKIAANAVTADTIEANAVTVGKVAAGAIRATEIAADAITASKMAITNVTNLYLDYDCVDPDYLSGTFTRPDGTAIGLVGRRFIRIAADTATQSVTSKWIEVEPGAEYIAWAAAALTDADGGNGTVQLQTGSVDVDGVVTLVRTVTIKAFNTAVWQDYSEVVLMAATERRARFRYVRVGDTNASAARFGAPRLHRRSDASLIVDGAVKANKIEAGAVETDKIAAGAIVASKIAAGTIAAVHLQAVKVISASVQIGDALITSAKIGDLQVETIKIGNNAVTTMDHANTAGSISVVTGAGTFVTVQTLTITKARAQPVLLDAQCLVLRSGTGTGTIYARVMRGATMLRLVSFTYADGFVGMDAESSTQYRLMLPVVDSSTASGSVTYTLEVGTTLGSVTATSRFIGTLNAVK